MKEDKKIALILGSHAHIPSGSSESEFEYIYENRMCPFISNLYRYSNINAVLHYSGVLLYWVERTHPEFFMLIDDMVNRKQIEMIGGGFYEPMFPIIPAQDRIGQIELMTTYLRKHFSKRPIGCWIPGMVWEQQLVSSLSVSDINYTFLSHEQFKLAGMKDDALFYPCITEDQGKIIVVFPVSLSVEKDLAEKSFSLTFTELKNDLDGTHKKHTANPLQGSKIVCVFPERILSSSDEAPDTVWHRFFEEVSLNENIVETTLPSRILKNQKTFRKASFPNSSMLENNFSPRNFIIEHDEVSGIYSKMIFTNALINQLKGDKSRKYSAREEMWKAQDAYIFTDRKGYLRNEIRKTAYSSLLRAESYTKEKGKTLLSLIQYDFNFDGIKEYLFQDNHLNCYIRQKGASIFELDYLPKQWNYLDCGTDEFGKKTAFADLFAAADTSLEELVNHSTNYTKNKKNRFCFNELYEVIEQERKGKLCFKLHAAAEDIPFACLEINKCYSLKKDNITVSYVIKNTAKDRQEFLFIPQIDFSFAGLKEENVRFYSIEASDKDVPIEKVFNTSNLKILDVVNEIQIILTSTRDFSGCMVPAFRNDLYQASRILPVFSVNLEPDEIWNNEFTLKFSH